MEINLKDTLRKLRQQKNITQEALAGHLGITSQSVGKWERGEGYPDITLLPKIALYFNVTIDELLNVGKLRIEQEINNYMSESKCCKRNGDNAKNLELWEKAYREFPNDCRVMAELMNAVNRDAKYPCPKEDKDKILYLGERILQESTDSALRENAVQTLCFTCAGAGDEQQALHYAEMGGSFYTTKEELRASALTGEEGVKACQDYLVSLLLTASMTASQMVDKMSFTPAEEICAYQFSIDLLKLLFSDGNAGFYANNLSWFCFCIAKKYAELEDAAKTLEYLEQSARYAVAASTAVKAPYTAFLVNRLVNDPSLSFKNYKGNACNLRLQGLSWEGYDFIRNNSAFQKIAGSLKAHAEVLETSADRS